MIDVKFANYLSKPHQTHAFFFQEFCAVYLTAAFTGVKDPITRRAKQNQGN